MHDPQTKIKPAPKNQLWYFSLTRSIDLAQWEIDHHVTEANRLMDAAQEHLIQAEFAEMRLQALERSIPAGKDA